MKIVFELNENEFAVTPINTAEALIMSCEEIDTKPLLSFQPQKIKVNTFEIDELMELAEHLITYCKYNKKRDEEV